MELLKLRQEISYGRREGEKSRRRVVLIKRQRGGKKKVEHLLEAACVPSRDRERGGERIRSRHNYAALRADLIILGEQPGGRPYVRSN